MIFSLVYVSSANSLWTRTELQELLDQCRSHNADLGITGMLLYRTGNVMQLLEGEEQAVHDLYEKVARDPRHHDVITIWSGYDENGRQYPDWTMGFQDLDETPADLPGTNDFLTRPISAKELTQTSNLGQELLQMFRKFR